MQPRHTNQEGATAPSDASPMEVETYALQRALDRLEDQVTSIDNQLNPVKNAVRGDAAAGAAAPPDSPLSPLADLVRTAARRVENARQRLDDLQVLLEV